MILLKLEFIWKNILLYKDHGKNKSYASVIWEVNDFELLLNKLIKNSKIIAQLIVYECIEIFLTQKKELQCQHDFVRKFQNFRFFWVITMFFPSKHKFHF